MERFETRWVGGTLHRGVDAPRFPGAIELGWPRAPGRGPGVGTGDLRFDGTVRTEGPGWRISGWLTADLRRELLALAQVGTGRVRVDRGRLLLELQPDPDRPRAEGLGPTLDAMKRWSEGLTRSLRRLLFTAQADPDPRVRAVAGRRLLDQLGTRRGRGAEVARVSLLEAPGLPDWLALEAFLGLWRSAPRDRRRWAELALARRRSSLGRVVTQAVLWSDVPLDVLAHVDPTRAAAEIELAWRRGSEAERSRLRERVEDLPARLWARLHAARGRAGGSGFAALSEARRGRLSAPDLRGGELALEDD